MSPLSLANSWPAFGCRNRPNAAVKNGRPHCMKSRATPIVWGKRDYEDEDVDEDEGDCERDEVKLHGFLALGAPLAVC